MPEARRIDQWLWFARIVKSRSEAQRLIAEGHVRLNRVKIEKPGKEAVAGDIVTVLVRDHVRVLKISSAGKRRGPAAEAQRLYEEIPGDG